MSFPSVLAEGLAADGPVLLALATIDDALVQIERNDERWCVAELLRLKGELVLLNGAPKSAIAAEGCYLKSLD